VRSPEANGLVSLKPAAELCDPDESESGACLDDTDVGYVASEACFGDADCGGGFVEHTALMVDVR
jgi:hypothetical protein